jgi:hypothetical protein
MNFIDDSPRDIDICFGKGHGVGSRRGNKEYHAYIVATVPLYIAMKNTVMRSALFREIVNVMKNGQRRFLKEDAESGKYFEVSDIVAHAKVGQVNFPMSSLLLIPHGKFSKLLIFTFCA